MLTMTQIRKSFGGIEVLHGVDFTVEPGQVHALVGHNGAGKSTLMKVLGGLYHDYSGTITLDGRTQHLRTPKESLDAGVAIIYQDFALVPDLDVAHNIALGREPGGRGWGGVAHRALARRSAQEAERFGITLPMTTPVRRLGVADQQLTEIVRALARDVSYLVMDEPTARLAPAERAQLFRIIAQLAERGVGVVYISHFLDEVVEVADVVTVLRDGAVRAVGPASDWTADTLARELVGEDEIGDRPVVPAPGGPAAPARSETGAGAARLEVRALAVEGRPPTDLTVAAGEIVALAGLVGSGRTRWARALIGDLRTEGRVLVDGRPLGRRNPRTSARAGLLLVPEDRKVNGLVLTGSVRENIELTALGTHLSRGGLVRLATVDRVVRDLLARFRVLPPRPEILTKNLSGGNAQKVLVARAVAARPKAIVLDQPTAGVDIGAKAELHTQVRSMAAAGTAVVVISDDLDEMLDLADRVVVLANGQMIQDAPAASFDRASLLAAMSRTAVA
ncbi:sugar ABC transporter ATP-binding protein [Actinotalea sp. M2MS4P-6]|uniref:sugar ABC transporter ATP-binding protein n=1 Tax=Actinotalea sp. M2MS4P-6 TaxID=2983762 RepID=UPI0021E4E644|nr:sugar ABC transporter ATP-binding protein [Actinotalea sp. M2MS4P-6]MCV2394356.1 sugar ABC transporter ATP-binding protein [Actinotalea sp. M2MS4P-6]